MSRVKITNKVTGVKLLGEFCNPTKTGYLVRLDGTTTENIFYADEWEIEPLRKLVITKPSDVNELIKLAREYEDALSGGEDPNWLSLVSITTELATALEALNADHTESEKALIDSVGELNAEVERLVSRLRHAQRQRDDERAAKEGNIRALDKALERAERAEAELADETKRADDNYDDVHKWRTKNRLLTAQLQAVKHIAGVWEGVAAVHHPDEQVYLVDTYMTHVRTLRNAIRSGRTRGLTR